MCRAQGVTYNNQLRTLSWPIASDLPSHAQRSADEHQDAYDTLHPMKFTQNRAQFESSFANSYGSFGMQLSVRASRIRLARNPLQPPARVQRPAPSCQHAMLTRRDGAAIWECAGGPDALLMHVRGCATRDDMTST